MAAVVSDISVTTTIATHSTSHHDTWCELATLWEIHLKEKGVKLPKKNSKLGDAVLFLYINKSTFVHIDLIKKFVA